MIGFVKQFLQAVVDSSTKIALSNILLPMADRFSSFQITSAALVIKAGSSALVKTGASACQAVANGVLRSITAATDMAALSGTVANATFNVFVYTINSAGTLATTMGGAGASLAAVTFPQIPVGSAVIGFTIINPTGTGNFVGGTTPIDDGTVVPNAVHVSVVGPFDPTIND